ncbi:hypothetical protein GA0115254_11356 [Streptomyces sp. Ncost-T10-10d]|nr:hypothetical protein [Streptomyces sp. Ncost-T10-10d]SCF72654.1 hypothetical protein GA0115254_11356 [Streptomyces sp. Ncost-T10-10d]
MSDRWPAEGRNAQAGQPVPQAVDDAPASRRRVIDILVEAKELAERNTVQPSGYTEGTGTTNRIPSTEATLCNASKVVRDRASGAVGVRGRGE